MIQAEEEDAFHAQDLSYWNDQPFVVLEELIDGDKEKQQAQPDPVETEHVALSKSNHRNDGQDHGAGNEQEEGKDRGDIPLVVHVELLHEPAHPSMAEVVPRELPRQ